MFNLENAGMLLAPLTSSRSRLIWTLRWAPFSTDDIACAECCQLGPLPRLDAFLMSVGLVKWSTPTIWRPWPLWATLVPAIAPVTLSCATGHHRAGEGAGGGLHPPRLRLPQREQHLCAAMRGGGHHVHRPAPRDNRGTAFGVSNDLCRHDENVAEQATLPRTVNMCCCCFPQCHVWVPKFCRRCCPWQWFRYELVLQMCMPVSGCKCLPLAFDRRLVTRQRRERWRTSAACRWCRARRRRLRRRSRRWRSRRRRACRLF